MNILIMNHTGTQAHLGCQATSAALEQVLHRKFPGAAIKTDTWNARRRLRKAKSLLPLVTKLHMRLPTAHYRDFREADLIVVNGEGMFYPAACNAPHAVPNQRLLEAKLAKTVLGKQLWIVNHGLDSQSKVFDELIGDVYQHADYVAAREKQTLDYLHKLGFSESHQAADACFSLELPPPAQHSPWEGKVLLTDSSAWPIRGIPPFYDEIAAVVEAVKERGLDIGYLSIRTDGRDANIAQKLGLEYFSASDKDEFLAHLQTARLVISGRFHMNVFAILCGVPYLPFDASTNKNTALNEFTEYPIPAFNFEKHTLPEIDALLEKALSEQDSLRSHLTEKLVAMREYAAHNVAGTA